MRGPSGRGRDGAAPSPHVEWVQWEWETLCRDVAKLVRYFSSYGLEARDFAQDAWSRYCRGKLGR